MAKEVLTNLNVDGDVTATNLKKSGGTSDDILLGDGSTTARSAIATVYVQTTEPTTWVVGDIWIKT